MPHDSQGRSRRLRRPARQNIGRGEVARGPTPTPERAALSTVDCPSPAVCKRWAPARMPMVGRLLR
jgi:hypothetical protein